MSIKRSFVAVFALVAAVLWMSQAPVLAKGKTHHLVVQVNDGSPKTMNLALNNVQNVRKYYSSVGDNAVVEVVAYGPGLKMYTADSPVKSRIAAMALESKDVQFSACNNTLRHMEKKAGKKIPLLAEATIVPSGAIRVIELQEEGYSYLKP